jgi:hypothetical protein
MPEDDPHAPTIKRTSRDPGHVRATVLCLAIASASLVGAVYVFATSPFADVPYFIGGLLIGAVVLFLYIAYDQWKMANYKSEVEDVIERTDVLLERMKR